MFFFLPISYVEQKAPLNPKDTGTHWAARTCGFVHVWPEHNSDRYGLVRGSTPKPST
jgi:hypothetical protein